MNHFILTRFNLKLWWKADKVGTPVQTDEWLRERFRLFDTYCWRSVMAQTERNFKWICLFDEDTPQEYKERVKAYREQWDGFFPFFIGRNETANFQQCFREKVALLADKDDDRVLTTYLDNDDCLRNDFIQTLQQMAAKARYGTVFSFKYGIQYYEELNMAVRVPYANNHFLTLYERIRDGKVRTIWTFWHYSIYKYHNIHIETIATPQRPMWIETIHRGNVDNDVKMTLSQHLILRRNYLRLFGLPIRLRPVWQSVAMYATVFQIRFFKQILRRLKNKWNETQ